MFLQFLEHNQVFKILRKRSIVGYFRWLADILIMYNNQITQIHNTPYQFNSTHMFVPNWNLQST
jgi:hypothetical protein